ncbi:MAG: nitrous oxide-stimulated promoter family protein [Campylobacterales bacterium]|nr:nitrous oxide-stimulated promoter family protein [Campylobacterales bacterium]
MKEEKFTADATTVLKFIAHYCEDKHDAPKTHHVWSLMYRGKVQGSVEASLCAPCKETFEYSLARLQGCPHEEKPSCRKCPAPCYDKPHWKLLARIMRHSGMKLGLLKIKKLFTGK